MKIAFYCALAAALCSASTGRAQDSNAGRNAAIFRTLNLELDGGRVSFSSSNASLSNLFILLRLKAQPQLVDDRRLTHQFMALFPSSETARFRQIAGRRGDWKGEDEFQQEDTRKEFLKQYRSRILSMVPEFPMDLVIDKSLPTRSYDAVRGGFDLKDLYGTDYGVNNLWGSASTASGLPGAYHQGFGEIVLASPVRFPNFLKATEQDARAIREAERASKSGAEVIHARLTFSLEDVRTFSNQQKYIVDTQFGSLKIASNLPLRPSVSLSDPVYTAKRPYSGSIIDRPAILNADLTRLLAAKASSGLLSDATFVRNSLLVRVATERKMLIGGLSGPDASNWGFAMPSGLLEETSVEPRSKDIDGYSKWMRERATEIGDVVRVRGIRAHNGNIQIAKVFDQWQVGRLAPVSERSLGELKQKYADSIGFFHVPSWDDMSVLLSMTESEHWMPVRSGFGSSPNIFVDFKIAAPELLSAQGKPLLVLRMEPVAYGTEGPGGVQARPLTASAAVSGYRFDILGIKLGDDVDEAKDKILAAFGDYQTGVKINSSGNDPVIPAWTQIDAGKDGVVHERFLIGTLAGSRKIAFIKRAHGPGMPRTDGVEINGLINQKYGPSKKLSQHSAGRSPNPSTMSRLETSTGCWPQVGFPYDHDNANYAFITDRCGEVLAIQIVDGRPSYMLYDSTLITNARIAASKAPKAPDTVKGSAGRL